MDAHDDAETNAQIEGDDAPKRKPGRPKAEPKPDAPKEYVTILALKKFHLSATDTEGGSPFSMSLKIVPDQTVMNVKASVASGLAKAGLARIV